jgi:hypothetical protein
MTGLETFSGTQGLMPALQALYPEEGAEVPDLAVVRGFITSASLLEKLNDPPQQKDLQNLPLLYEAVPELHQADAFIAEQWGKLGYTNMGRVSSAILDLLRIKGIQPHVDDAIYGDSVVEAIVQGSLCLTGERTFAAELLPVEFKTPSGEFDLEARNRYTSILGELSTQIFVDGRKPRTSAELVAGDLALMHHHPYISLHSVTHKPDQKSVARLITWRAAKTKG